MLTITQKQMDALAVPLMKRLEPACLEYFRKSDPERFNGALGDALRPDIARFIQESRHFDFQRNASIMEYVRLCIVHKTNYESLMARPKVSDIFRKPELNEVEKLYLVEKTLRRP